MATTIDIENAKQIRQPMDVLIEMEMASDDVTLTYSGYSSTSKVTDGVLSQPTWPMRGLADLQGDGFPLNGSRVLYDSSTTASQTNGKLGVRGNIGQSVTITITGDESIASLFVHATGAESITFGGTTTPIINNVVTIPVGDTSVTITLNPAKDTERIEVSQIGAGAKFVITNENLIRATVSLRSDLSIINPTLPESELNVEVYQDTDVSEAVAAIPEDTPITYSAGYPGDMSTTRKFYVTGQVTWADNVLSIQAVDAVHFLDVPVPSMLFAFGYGSVTYVLKWVDRTLRNFSFAEVQEGTLPTTYYSSNAEGAAVSIGITFRELLAELNNFYRFRNVPNKYVQSGKTSFVIDYTDAGMPFLRWDPSTTPSWNLNEEDFADVTKNIDRQIGAADVNAKIMRRSSGGGNTFSVGNAAWIKNVGASYAIDDYAYRCVASISQGRYDSFLPMSSDGAPFISGVSPIGVFGAAYYERPTATLNQNVRNSEYQQESARGGTRALVYSQFVPWSLSLSPTGAPLYQSQNAWWSFFVSQGIIQPDATQVDITLVGDKLLEEPIVLSVAGIGNGEKTTVDVDKLLGRLYFSTANNATGESVGYPNMGVQNAIKRSNKTGSFKWKGDPRMQPRDNATITMRDGTQKVVTLENITLTHEGGGLSAEITYREGAI